jgi:putative membrane protein
MGMGAADVVPGVSGGTIAFITGIYEELVHSIKSINLNSLKKIFSDGIPGFWRSINGWFLVSVFAGILLSVFSLARLLETWLELYPIVVWSFFFGLIVASAIYIAGKIKQWNLVRVIGLITGIVIAYLITILTPAQTSEASWFIFLSGALAICAMILPGISGAFILLLLGKYQFILGAIGDLNITILLVFAFGALIGLISFSNVLAWFLRKFHDTTVAVLAGFMIGSLNKVWPWKETTETFIDRHGHVQPLVQNNVLPGTYESASGNPSFFLYAIIAALAGFFLIFIIERITGNKKNV